MKRLIHALIALLTPLAAHAADWTNSGGIAGRTGLTTEVGPDAEDLLWNGGRSSIIAWQPVIVGDRVFMVRQTGFPPGGEPNGSPVVAMNLHTGAELWAAHVPYDSGDWTTWVAGARDGKVYAARSGNGASVSDPMYALDETTGAILWVSDAETTAGAYDGVVFAPDGDLIVGDFRNITRIRHTDGATVFQMPRVCSVSSSCGVAATGDAIYAAEAAPGGHVINRYRMDNGAFEYSSSLMPGFSLQNTPMVGPDGTVYLSRTQNNATVDFFYAFEDTGAALVEKWNVPAGWTTVSEFAVGPDGSVYMMGPGNVIQRLDPASGAVLNASAPIPADFSQPRMGVDAEGRLFFSNGAFSNGRFYSFNADLTERWSRAVANINIGAPAIGRDGTLVICGVGTNVRAYRTERACPGDLDGDGMIGLGDLAILLANYGTPSGADPEDGDLDGDGDIDLEDLAALLARYGSAC